MSVGADTVNVQTDLFAQFLNVGHSAEDSDRTGQGSRLGVDVIRCTGDIVSARCCIIAHRHHYRQTFGLQRLHAVPDLLACVSTATRAVHAEHNSLDLIVLGDGFDLLDSLFGCYTVVGGIGLDVTLGVEHGYAVLQLGFRALNLCELGGAHKLVIFRTAHHTQHLVHLFAVDERVSQVVCNVLLSLLQTHVLVSIAVQIGLADAARCADSCAILVPYTLQVKHCLLLVGLGHRGAEQRLHGALERADLHYLHLHADLLHQAGEVHLLSRQTSPRDVRRGVDVHFVSHGSNVVVRARIVVRVGNDPLS